MTLDFTGTTALITGASSGLGVEFATRLAARGAAVVLVARRTDRLETLAAELQAAHGIRATPIGLDLAQPRAGARMRAELEQRGIAVQTLVNNAGFGTHGPFADADAAVLASEIQLNVASLVDLSREFLPDLLAAAAGGASAALVNVASTAAYQPTPFMAVYGATKAFVLNFTEAIAFETRDSGVRVLALSPGATRTEFFDVVGSEAAAVGSFQSSEQVVATALKALDRRHTPASVVSGRANALTAAGAGVLPRGVILSMSGRLLSE
ncbi:SDR family NAD(P)-dependent oxidoreductase [Herbiconiux sp. 11R-BC]|uniref:SDR family NAD(P)-dependent oxidoreductase n=1 Tax=Herbiconiux sp. 11R-BC TaxID=3111637 RepID=UPI003BFE12DE